MNHRLIAALSLFFLCACNSDREVESNAKTNDREPVAAVKITVLTDLPDSLQPKTTFLKNAPRPQTVVVPRNAGGSYNVLTNGKVRQIKLLPPTVHRFTNSLTHRALPVELQGIADFTNFTSRDGLAVDLVYCGLKDKKGNLWFGTDNGVSRYDGKSFTTFTKAQGLVYNAINCILEDRHGNLWFGTSGGGASRYDGTSFTAFSTGRGLANEIVNSITEDKQGNLWFGTFGGGASRYDGKTFTTITTEQGLPSNVVFCITEDRQGHLWFGTDAGVCCYDGKSFKPFTTAQGLANNNVFCGATDQQGNLWFGTTGGGVSRYDGKSFTNFTTARGLANNNVWGITKDQQGKLWFGTDGGVSRYDGHSFTTLSTAQGLANNFVQCITEDKDGYLWFSTLGGGVSRFNGWSFSSFNKTQGLANNGVWGITEDRQGNLWFGTNEGVSRYDGQSFTNYTTAQGLANNYCRSLLEDREGNLWICTAGGGVSRYDGKSFINITTAQGLANNTVKSIYEDRQGNLWFGTDNGGVSRYDGRSFTNFTSTQGLANNFVYSITEDQHGNLWFGTWGGGISCFDGRSFITFTTAHGLAGNIVVCITLDRQGNLWFGTNGSGVSMLGKEKIQEITARGFKEGNINLNKGNPEVFENFSIADGLPDNAVTQVIEDENGKMLLGTKGGICELLPSSSSARGWVVGRTYNANTGLPVIDVNLGKNCLFKDNRGLIWIATGSDKTALVRFDPEAVLTDTNQPVPVIQSIKISNENICWLNLQDQNKAAHDSSALLLAQFMAFGRPVRQEVLDAQRKKFGDILFSGITRWYPMPENLVLPYAHNSVTFEFGAIETGRNNQLQYQCILEGYDEEWSPVTDKTSATFGNIFEGIYTFKLKVRSPEGAWSEPVIYNFKVSPPWYRSLWAFTFYLLSILLAHRTFVKWRERRFVSQKVRLEKTVETRTAELVKEKKKSDDLLLNILPEEVAEELKAKGEAEARHIDEATVLFTDFEGFTILSEQMEPKELVSEIDICFRAFDQIMQKHGVEKIKTIGDAYMAAGGLPAPKTTHAEDVVRAALDIQQFMVQHKADRMAEGKSFFEIRIGIHSGPVVAGIVGLKKFAYDIWGDTVNVASRMESAGSVGRINISGSTYALVKDKFRCLHRGKIAAKNKGEIDMYFVESRDEAG